jgi:hypothetical protein
MQISFLSHYVPNLMCIFLLSVDLYSSANLPQVHILLPSLVKIRTVVDKLRLMSDSLAIRASHDGQLQLSIRTDSVKVVTQWTGLTNLPLGSVSCLICTSIGASIDPAYFR